MSLPFELPGKLNHPEAPMASHHPPLPPVRPGCANPFYLERASLLGQPPAG